MVQQLTTLGRQAMIPVARSINWLGRGYITPNHVTLVSLLGHGLVAWFIWQGDWIAAAIALVVFGLLDAVDGALARLQERQSSLGVLYDASADRAKEAIVYGALVAWFAEQQQTLEATLAVAALGGSILVSYIKAKAETLINSEQTASEKNRVFATGLMQYQVRMTMLVVGLLVNQGEISAELRQV